MKECNFQRKVKNKFTCELGAGDYIVICEGKSKCPFWNRGH